MNYTFNNKWQILKINEICIAKGGTSNQSGNFTSQNGSIPYIRPKDIFFKTIINSAEQVSENNISYAALEIVPKDSILISASGGNAGNIAMLGKDAVVNHNVFYLTIQNPLIKPKFLYYYLFLKRHLLIRISKYNSRVSYRVLKDLNIPFPSLEQQDFIIQYLDMHLRKLNNCIRSSKKVLDEIQNEKQLLLNESFINSSAEKDFAKWSILKYKDCGIVQAGITPNGAIKEYYGFDFPLFKPTDLCQGIKVKHAETFLTPKGLKQARHVKADSLLVCTSGVNLGKVGISQVDGACNQQMISFAPGSKVMSNFVYFQMNSDYFKKQFLNHSRKSIVSKSAFNNLLLAVTDLNSQRKIINKICREIELLEKKESDITKELRALDESKYNLLSFIFNYTKA